MDVVEAGSAALVSYRAPMHHPALVSRQAPCGGAARSRNSQWLSPVAGYQIAGSSSRPLPNWILMKVQEMDDLELLEQTFPGGRPTPSGKHLQWDILFIRVRAAD